MQIKIKKFIERNQKRNQKLYQSEMKERIDYIVCPVSNQRLSMIKSSYIVNVLEMTVEEYDRLYPGIRGVSEARKRNIKMGLKKIDAETGLSKYEVGQVKARKILKQKDSDGLSGYDKKGKKTRATHMANVDEFGRNGYRRQADARLTTILPNGLTIEQNAHKKQKQTLIKNNKTGTGGASKLSKRVLKPIIDWLDQNEIKYYFDKNEYGIKDTATENYYFWDLTIPKFKMAIEYQSTAWHADPTLSESEWKDWKPPRGKKKSADEVLTYDYNKARSLFKNRQFLTYYIWQSTQDLIVKEIICLLKTMNMKY